MNNYPLVLLNIFLWVGGISSQQLSPFVISTSGGFYNNSSGMLSFTTGEMSAVETYSSPSAILTQGFQQSWDFGTYIFEHPGRAFSFGVYPNPSNGHFNLFIETEVNEYVDVKILDVLGQEIYRTSISDQNGINTESIDLSYANQGIYLISLTVKESGHGPAFHFVKKIYIVK